MSHAGSSGQTPKIQMHAAIGILQRARPVQNLLQGLEDVDTELLILSEEGFLKSFCEQSEQELRAIINRAGHLDTAQPSPYAIMGLGGGSAQRGMPPIT